MLTNTDQINRKKLFNPQGDDSISNRRMVGGDPTNFNNFNDVKYSWANEMYRIMMGNFWIPEKIDMAQDKLQWRGGAISEADMEGVRQTLSFLTFLDSIQTHNLPNIANYITAPEVSGLLTLQGMQEYVHSQSYAYVFESIMPAEERRRTMYLWRDNESLYKRNEYIAGIYQRFVDNPTPSNLGETLLANYILESLYFYNGFNFFYNLAYRNLMLGTASNIRYINRDESTHVALFKRIIDECNREMPGFITKTMVDELFGKAVEQEIEWSCGAYGSGIVGTSVHTIEDYTRQLADMRIKALGFEPMYGGNIENPYKHLERFKPNSGEDVKQNFFEGTVTEYNMASVIKGWDEI